MTLSKSLLALVMLEVTFKLVNSAPVVETILSDPRLEETRKWATASGVLDNLDIGDYGFEVSLVLPSNEAIQNFRENHPDWEKKLIRSPSNIETLLLFASTDSTLQVDDIKNDSYSAPESIVSLLSQYSSIEDNGTLCVSDFARTSECDEDLPCCGKLDLRNVIKVDEGNIFIINKLLLPQEIIDEIK